MRPWLTALALLVCLAPAAMADGVHAKIEGPAADGVTYTVRTYDLDAADAMDPWGLAEGLVGDKRQSVLLRLTPTDEHGVYTFTRTWPQDGKWMLRVVLGHPPAPVTVATLRDDGSIKRNRLYRNSDGSRECHKALKPKGGADEDC